MGLIKCMKSNPYDELFMKYFGEYGKNISDLVKQIWRVLFRLGFTEKIKGNTYQTPKRIEQQIDEICLMKA